MKKALLSLALAACTISSAFAALPGSTKTFTKTFDFNICEAYPATANYGHPGSINEETCESNECWTGVSDPVNCFVERGDDPVIKAVPGILCLGARFFKAPTGKDCDVAPNLARDFNCNAFVCLDSFCTDPVIQICRLTKVVGKSDKCPGTYGGQTYYQFGIEEIRTWWTLIYTSPGTTFTLEIKGVCQQAGRPVTFETIWTWTVIATWDSLIAALDVLHQNTLSVCEFPCISSEDVYEELHNSISYLAEIVGNTALTTGTPQEREIKAMAQDSLFSLEAVITGFCSLTDCFVFEECFSQQYPAGDAVQFGDFGYTGIIDTIENPCVCKLIADLEYLAEQLNIVSD